MGKCHFKKEWLAKHQWLDEVKGNAERAKCRLCKCDFSISNKGYADVKQHFSSASNQRNENSAAKTVAIDHLFPSEILDFRVSNQLNLFGRYL